jgi:hypothetical protein
MTSGWIAWLACIALTAGVVRCWEHSGADALTTALATHDAALVACKWTNFDRKI